ncbi:hypothetical protein AB6A40_001216 [Gnathostoma spinigerum]|uniref:Uncharacterized protein n=1 Tax=Gnathostoma spinigerum TaxID=75299 RepID=A0ABD6ECT9_9BILA
MPSTRSGRSTSASESEATTSLRTRRRSEANADQPNHSRLPHITKENPIKNEVETAVDILTDARQTRSVKIESPSQISSRSTRRTRSITSGSENDFSEINSEKQSLPKRSTKAHYSKNLEEIAASPGVNEANKNDVLQEMGSPSRKRTSTCSAKSSKAAGPEAGTLTPKDELEQGIRMSSRLRKPTTRMLELLEQEQNKQEMRVCGLCGSSNAYCVIFQYA